MSVRAWSIDLAPEMPAAASWPTIVSIANWRRTCLGKGVAVRDSSASSARCGSARHWGLATTDLNAGRCPVRAQCPSFAAKNFRKRSAASRSAGVRLALRGITQLWPSA